MCQNLGLHLWCDGTNFTNESKLHYTNTRGAYKAIVDKEADNQNRKDL